VSDREQLTNMDDVAVPDSNDNIDNLAFILSSTSSPQHLPTSVIVETLQHPNQHHQQQQQHITRRLLKQQWEIIEEEEDSAEPQQPMMPDVTCDATSTTTTDGSSSFVVPTGLLRKPISQHHDEFGAAVLRDIASLSRIDTPSQLRHQRGERGDERREHRHSSVRGADEDDSGMNSYSTSTSEVLTGGERFIAHSHSVGDRKDRKKRAFVCDLL